MDWRRFFDFQTVLACQSVLAIVYAFIFLGLKRVYPQVRGARVIAISFLLIVPDALCVGLSSHLSPVVSVMMADTLMLASLVAMYEAVLHFTGGKNHRWELWVIASISFAIVYFYTDVKPQAAPRIVAVALSMAIIRGFTAWALLLRAQRSSQRWMLGFFGLFMASLSAMSILRAWRMLWHAADYTPAQKASEQGGMLATGMFYLATAGVCFLILTARELIAQRRMAGDWTPIDGHFDLRALEVNLAVELQRFDAQQAPFCIAMVEVDSIEALPDHGRAAIRDVGETLAGQLRGTDRIGRFSRHEFVLFFASTTHVESLVAAERCAAQVAHVRLPSGALTLSIGITECAPGDTPALLIARAERALKLVQNDGGDGHRVLLAKPLGPVAETSVTAIA